MLVLCIHYNLKSFNKCLILTPIGDNTCVYALQLLIIHAPLCICIHIPKSGLYLENMLKGGKTEV